MIFVGGVQILTNSTDEGNDDLATLIEHPAIVSASLSFKAIPEKKFSTREVSGDEMHESKHVYLFQREYATVDPSLVDLIGTDEATTCVGVVIRNRDNGMTSVSHMDSPKIVNLGLSQMLSKLVDSKLDTEMDVHLIGGFESTPRKLNGDSSPESSTKQEDHSYLLCAKIVEALRNNAVKFHIQTLFILGHNTKRNVEGVPLPIFTGFLVETMSGAVIPATFDETTRCPDELIRRIRVSACFEDPFWKGKLLDTYDTETDQFVIAPCSWSVRFVNIASYLQQFPDTKVLQTCSTSPFAEAPDFVHNQRRQWDYLIQHPNWKETFHMGQPRVFKRPVNGGWVMVEQAHKRKTITLETVSSQISLRDAKPDGVDSPPRDS